MIDSIQQNVESKYECGLQNITGQALIYMPIKEDLNFCFYSLLSVNKDGKIDYIISYAPINTVKSRYKNSKTNIIRLPEINLRVSKEKNKRFSPTRKQTLKVTRNLFLSFSDYVVIYNARIEEQKARRILKATKNLWSDKMLEDILNSPEKAH